MKTSTKILAFLLLCIPASLWAYNSLLKKQLVAKNFLREMRANPEYVDIEQNVPAFKHLVVDGALYTGRGFKQAANNVSWIARVKVENTNAHKPMFKFRQKYDGVIKYHVKNDTLYISFYKENNPVALENQGDDSPFLTINGAGNLQSVTGTSTRFTTWFNFNAPDSFDVSLSDKSEYYFNTISLKKLNIRVNSKSKLILGDVTADAVYYSLFDNCRMEVDPLNIKKFIPGQIDSTARIAINGNANQLKSALK